MEVLVDVDGYPGYLLPFSQTTKGWLGGGQERGNGLGNVDCVSAGGCPP